MLKIALTISAVLVFFASIYLFLRFKQLFAVSKGDTIKQYEQPQRALLVIDLQKDLTTPDGCAVINLDQTDKVIANVNRLIENAARSDFHVIYIRHEVEPDFLIRLLPKAACLKGSVGAELDQRINIVNGNIYTKNVLDAFSNRQLDKFLEENQVDQLFFSGVDARFCVAKTLKAALNRGYKTTVVTDAVGTKNATYLSKQIEAFRKIGANVITTEQFLSQP